MEGDSTTNDTPEEEPLPEPVPTDDSLVEDSSAPAVDPIPDTRLYAPDHEDWEVHIKRDSERHFCYAKHPGEDWFHLLLSGEIYVARQDEKYCLRCALRMGFLTEDRLFWQHRVPKKRPRVV
ncbi:MAG: hypothetical protein AABP62_07995 [Planctomycetota bacterium]